MVELYGDKRRGASSTCRPAAASMICVVCVFVVFCLHTRWSGPGAVLRGGQGHPCENSAAALFPCPPNKTGGKVAGLRNSCIHSVASRSWCQITPLIQWCIMSSGILAPPP